MRDASEQTKELMAKRMMKTKNNIEWALVFTSMLFAACNEDETGAVTPGVKTDSLSEEWYAGGKLGTVFNTTSSAYEMSTPAVDVNTGLSAQFQHGEKFFENVFVTGGSQAGAERTGLGPVYVRNSCIACHPSYGHGRRMERFSANDYGNGYLLVVTDSADNFVSSLTGMPQTLAVAPYLPPIKESGI